MASAHRRSGVRGLPPPKRWVLTCLGSKRCNRAHKASETRKLVVTLFTEARLRRLLGCAIPSLYQIPVIRIGFKSFSPFPNHFHLNGTFTLATDDPKTACGR